MTAYNDRWVPTGGGEALVSLLLAPAPGAVVLERSVVAVSVVPSPDPWQQSPVAPVAVMPPACALPACAPAAGADAPAADALAGSATAAGAHAPALFGPLLRTMVYI